MPEPTHQAIEQAFRQDPSDAGAFDTLHEIYTASQQQSLLANLCELRATALTDDDQACELLEQAADLYAELGDEVSEQRAVNRIVVRRPTALSALQRQQGLATAQQRWEELLRAMQLELEVWATDPANAHTVAEVHFRMGQVWQTECHRLDRTLYHYEQALASPQRPAQWIEATRQLQLSLGNWSEAAKLYRLELQLCGDGPTRANLLAQLAELLHHRLGDLEGAAALYEEALALPDAEGTLAEVAASLYASPEWPNPGGLQRASDLLTEAAHEHAEQRDHDATISYLRRALGADPNNSAAYEQLEQAHRRTGQWRDLERLYRQRSVLADGGDAVDIELKRGLLLEQELKDPEAALDCYAAILEQAPSSQPATERFRELCRSQNDFDKLLAHIDQALDQAEPPADQVELLLEAVSIHRDERHDPHAAAHLLRQALELDPHNPTALAAYGQYFEQRGDYQSLADLCHFAIEAASEDEGPSERLLSLWEQLARIYEHHLGNFSAAEDAWLQFQRLNPEDQGVQARLQRLDSRRERAEALTNQITAQLDHASTLAAQARVVESRAQQLYDQGAEHSVLIPLLRLAAEHGQGDPTPLRLLTDLYRKHCDAKGLAWALQRHLSGGPSRTDKIRMLRELADVYTIQLERPEDALRAHEQVFQLASGDDTAFEAILTLLRDNGNLNQLTTVLHQRAEGAPTTTQRVEALKQLAQLMDDEFGMPAEAMASWQAIVKLSPNHLEALEALSPWYERAGHYGELYAVIQRRLSLCTLPAERIELLRTRAQLAHRRLKKPDEAMDAYEQILALLPADREALSELPTIYQQRGNSEQLATILQRAYDNAEDPAEKLSLAFRLADVLEDELTDPERAIALYRQILDGLDPSSVEAHQRLKLLEIGRGHYEEAIEVAERELALIGTDPDQDARVLELATEVTALWRDQLHQPQQAALACERELTLTAEIRGILESIRSLYLQCEAYLPLVEMAPALDDQLQEARERESLYIDTGQVWETQLGDAEQAFNWYRRAYRLCGDHSAASNHLRRVAKRYRLWPELLAAYEEARRGTADPKRQHALLLRIAAISRDHLDMPEHACVALEEAISLDPEGSDEQLGQLIELSALTQQSHTLLPVYAQILGQTTDHAKRDDLWTRMIGLAETTLRDVPLALRMHLQRLGEALPHPEADHPTAARVGQIDELCASSNRWDSALAARQYCLIGTTATEQRIAILSDLGQLYETRLERCDRAFAARFQAILLDPDNPQLLQQLVRTGHLLLNEGPAPLDPADLFDPADLLAAHEPVPDAALAPLLAPSAPPGPPTIASPLDAGSPWDWIEHAYRHVLAEGQDSDRPRYFSLMARLWADEGGSPETALALLHEAATEDPANTALLDELEEMGHAAALHESLWQSLQQLIADTDREETLVDLHRRLAKSMQDCGQLQRAEPHLAALRKLDPTDHDTFAAIRELYTQQQRWTDLAHLLAGQLDSWEQSAATSAATADQRSLIVDELIQVYDERLGDPQAAARLLARRGEQYQADSDLHRRLGQLYERAGDWTRAVQSLQHVASLTPEDHQRLQLLLSIARIYHEELELADEAITAYQNAAATAAQDPEARGTLEQVLGRLEQLYEQHHRPDGLLEVLEQRRVLANEQPAVVVQLLCRRATILRQVGRPAEAAEELERAHALDGANLEVTLQLAEALRSAGDPTQAVALLKQEAAEGLRDGRDATQVADLFVAAAGILGEDLDDQAGCEWTLGLAVQASEIHMGALTALAACQRRLSAWADYAGTMVRLCLLMADDDEAVPQLIVTAQAVTEHCPEGAIELYTHALARSPESVLALDALIDLDHESPQRRDWIRRRLSQTRDPARQAALLVDLGKVEEYRQTPVDKIAAAYRQALEAVPDFIPAVDALSRLQVGHGELDAALELLKGTLARLSGAKHAPQAGPLYYRLGALLERLGRDEEGYRFLLDARRLMPRSLPVQLALGQNRYRAHRWREALRHLGAASDHPDTHQYSEFVAGALFSAGRCETMLRRPARATELFARALQFDPSHPGALREAAETELAAGHHEKAASMMDRLADRAEDARERIKLLRQAAELYGQHLDAPDQAARCYERLADAVIGVHPAPLDPEDREQLLSTMLPALERSGRHIAAASVARSIAQLTIDPKERQAHLLAAGDHYEDANEWTAADACRREVVARDPACHLAVAGLARSLDHAGDTGAMVALLEQHLALPPTTDDAEERELCSKMYTRLARGHETRNDPLAAIRALEQSLRYADRTATRLRLAALYRGQPQLQRAALQNYRVLGRDVSQVEALQALAETTATTSPYRSYCLDQVLQLVTQDAYTQPAALRGYCPPLVDVDVPYPGALGEADRRTAFRVAEETAMHEVLMTLWDAAAVFMKRRLTDYGAASHNRISPLEDSTVARVFSHVARAFDIKTAGLFLLPDEEMVRDVDVTATAPPALLISKTAASSYDVARLRFLMGRALQLSQPPLLLAVAMERLEFTQLLTAVLRAFHPRHMRGQDVQAQDIQAPGVPVQDIPTRARHTAETLRANMPYKVSRRLGELFRQCPNARFDSAAWRQAAWQSGNRAGLAACGDLHVALDVLRGEDPSAADLALTPQNLDRSPPIRDLLTFAASEQYYACRTSLGLADPPPKTG